MGRLAKAESRLTMPGADLRDQDDIDRRARERRNGGARTPVPGQRAYSWPPCEPVDASEVEQLEAHAVTAIEALIGRIASATLERRRVVP